MSKMNIFLFQRLAKRKQKKQVELDKCAFDPEHMEEAQNGVSFPMVSVCPSSNALLALFKSFDDLK